MTRLAIAADLHVDDFGTKVDEVTGLNARFMDGLAAVRHIAVGASSFGADALVIAGDYTEHRAPAPPRVARIIDELRRGPARQIHLRGNHDSERAGRSIVDVLAGVDGWEGYTAPGISLVGDVAVCVIPFLSKSYVRSRPDLAAADQADVFRILADAYLDLARGLFVRAQQAGASEAVLVGHQQLAGGRMNDAQAVFLGQNDLVVDARALAAIGYCAVVFGHVHRAQTVIDDPACPVLFTGSAHRVDFAEEAEDKSFVLLDIAGGRAKVDWVAIPARRFVTLRPESADIGTVLHADRSIEGAVVRVLDLPPEVAPGEVRAHLERLGAFEVQEIRRRVVTPRDVAGGLSEGVTPVAALEEYFAGDDDRDALVERGRELLAAVA